MLTDTHCHLTDEHLLPHADAVVGRAGAAGVERMVTVATEPADWREALALAAAHEAVYVAAGLHPHHANEEPEGLCEALARVLRQGKVVALGEIGLEYHYDPAPRARQLTVFSEQLQLARMLRMPVIVHCRDALDDTLGVLDDMQMRGAPLVFHCFTGTAAEATRVLDRGWHVSFAGVVTFRGADGVREAAKLVPADRLLVETDSPYLTPEPIRKVRPNEPAHVVHTVRHLAGLRGVTFEEMAQTCRRNADGFFRFGLPMQETRTQAS